MRHFRWLVWSGLVFTPFLHAAQNPATIPAPGPQAWVVDLVGVLPPGEVTALNALGDAVHLHDGAALAVVVIDSTGGADPHQFATDLFKRWGLGRRDRDNGLLLFVALNDRAAEIILGDGIDSDAEVAASQRIMQGTIVPRFRAGEPASAIGDGARACAGRFFGVRPAGAAPETAMPLEIERPSAVPPLRRPPTSAPNHPGLWFAGAGGVGVFGLLAWGIGRAIVRGRPRRCPHCAMTMQQLDEVADDAHLAATERAEEKVGSVDYEVWQCPGCHAVEKVRRGRWFTHYSQCPLCGGVTKNSTQRTLRTATTMSTGLVEVHEKCAHCSYQNTSTRTTPQVRVSSSTSSGSGRSSGGGSSAGRGASGRW